MADTGFSSTFGRAKPSSDAPRTGETHRSLQEPVLSSAEEELGLDTSMHDSGTTYTAEEGSAPIYSTAGSRPAWWMRMEDNLGRYVSEQPGRAALMALGAGALAAVLLGRGMRGRRRKD